jgi:superfamily II DNA or RNA helicase
MKTGLYEKLINNKLKIKLQEQLAADTNLQVDKAPVDRAEAYKVLSKYLAKIVEESLTQIGEGADNSLEKQVSFLNKLLAVIKGEKGLEILGDVAIPKEAEELMALLSTKNQVIPNKKLMVIRPTTSLSQTTLLTANGKDPQLVDELKKEIKYSDKIDILVSFIKWSGLRLIISDLSDFVAKGGQLRVITTSYMGATDVKAVAELEKLPNTEIKVSYDVKRTRLHAKAYIFYRNTGFNVAYIGSSNISNVAMTSGTEWNVKITAQDLPESIEKVRGTFETYWNSPEYETYKAEDETKLAKALKQETAVGTGTSFAFDIRPYPYQQEILDKLEAERTLRHSYRNLLVAATGTGKTVIAAFDYKRFKEAHPNEPCRLLFVAHREEILKQSLACFRGVLHDPNFGELFVGNQRPTSNTYLFISVQTLNSRDFIDHIDRDFYDFVIVDETHHIAASSYLDIVTELQPKILLGLTGTPERMDGEDILKYFNNKIAAEIRLPEAIERKLLCPFQYFGVSDSVDLSELAWHQGKYDVEALTTQLATEQRAGAVIRALQKYATDMQTVKGLGFCASIKHAEFMNDFFNRHDIPSICLTGQSTEEERNTAKSRLVKGEISFIFTVDLYNEGVDIPEVNTVLFLRPTESLTIFLQQLGRGLRLADGKECLTVLDFIGQANKKYNFETKLQALVAHTKHSLEKEIEKGFPDVPLGCYVELEKKAAEYVLENIKQSVSTKNGIIERMKTFTEDTGKELNLTNFLDYYQINPRLFYVKEDLFMDYVAAAKVESLDNAEAAYNYRKSMFRLTGINSPKWLTFLIAVLPKLGEKTVTDFSEQEKRMLTMFYSCMYKYSYSADFSETLAKIKNFVGNSKYLAELVEVFKYNLEHIDLVPKTLNMKDCPLELYCSYTKNQIIAALDTSSNPSSVRQGVKYFANCKTDVFFVTLNKAEKDYSPTTMYNDYSVNESMFHWQSQSTTSVESPTGQRYINHREQGSKVMLFVRESNFDEFKKADSFTFLGYMDFMKYEGSRPMNIYWHMEEPIPAKFLKQTNRMVAE